MTAERPSDELLARVVTGNANPGDAETVAAWTEADPARLEELARLRTAWAMAPRAASWDVDRAWARVANQVAGDPPTDVLPLRPTPSVRATLAWRLAAALLLTAGLATAWFALRSGDAGESHVYVTAAGERREVVLPDGSIVVLAPRSTLTLPAGFGPGGRTLTLEGEAWFSVVHHADQPLVVETATHLVRDIGTVFTVWARSGRVVRVAVLEGEVTVRQRTAGVESEHRLVAGDAARFAADTSAPTWRETNIPLDTLASWRDGRLDVVAESVGDVLAELTLWYGVPLGVADTSLTSRTVTATFSLDSLDHALEVMSLLLDATVERTADGVVLRPRP